MMAVTADLRTSLSEKRPGDGNLKKMSDLLFSINSLNGKDYEALSKTRVALHPENPDSWQALFRSSAAPSSADMYALTAKRSAPPHDIRKPEELSRAQCGLGTVQAAQTAIMICPWLSDGHDALSAAIAT